MFSEPIEAVQARIAKIIGRVSVARDYRIWHPAVDRLLKADEVRRQKRAASSFHLPWDVRFSTRRSNAGVYEF
jgi:hypothetical protein